MTLTQKIFFAALHRKNKAEDVIEDDMEAVVDAHNSKLLGSMHVLVQQAASSENNFFPPGL